MADKKRHITNSNDFQRYLDGSMTSKERYDFEKKLLDDEFENEALDGLSQLTPDEINSDLSTLNEAITSKANRRSGFSMVWRIAATVLLLAVCSFIVYLTVDFESAQKIAQKKVPDQEKARSSNEAIENPGSLDSLSQTDEYSITLEDQIEQNHISRLPGSPGEVTQSPVIDEGVDFESDIIAESVEEMIKDQKQPEPLEVPALVLKQSSEMESFDDMEVESAPDAKEDDYQSAVAKTQSAAPVALKKMEPSSVEKERAARLESSKTVGGIIYSSEDNEGIPGVNIVVKGSSTGVVTDIGGAYSIDVPVDSEVTLVISCVGYISEEVVVGDKTKIDMVIDPDMNALSEIVVTGYGTQTGNYDRSEYAYTPPKPVGGNGKFRDFVKAHIQYPVSGSDYKIKGTVKLKFTVGINGEIFDMQVLRSLGEDFDREAIRLVREGPKWEPAKERDSAVVRDVKVKIRFSPPKD